MASVASRRSGDWRIALAAASLSSTRLVLFLGLLAVLSRPLLAAERLVDRPPFDQVKLDEANHNAILQVEPLDLPNRRMPTQPKGNLTVALIDRPELLIATSKSPARA